MSDEPKFKTFTSPTGVEVEIVKIENSSLYGCAFVKGGKAPEEFDGHYTSPGLCEKQINKYFARVKEELEAKSAKKTA